MSESTILHFALNPGSMASPPIWADNQTGRPNGNGRKAHYWIGGSYVGGEKEASKSSASQYKVDRTQYDNTTCHPYRISHHLNYPQQ